MGSGAERERPLSKPGLALPPRGAHVKMEGTCGGGRSQDENTRDLRPDTAELLQAQAPTQGRPHQSHLPWIPGRGHTEWGGFISLCSVLLFLG